MRVFNQIKSLNDCFDDWEAILMDSYNIGIYGEMRKNVP